MKIYLHEIPLSSVEILVSGLLILATVLGLLYLCRDQKHLVAPLFTAFLLRSLAAFFHRVTSFNPDGLHDAVTFENQATRWAVSGCGNLWQYLDLSTSYVHSWLMANVYACIGPIPLGFQLVNVILSLLAIYYLARISRVIWNEQTALTTAWVAAFFPTFFSYSFIPLREAWIWVFFNIGLYYLVRWTQTDQIKAYLLGFAALSAATIFHGGLVIAMLAVAIYCSVIAVGAARDAYVKGTISRHSAQATGIIILTAILAALILNGVRLSSIGDVSDIGTQIDTINSRIAGRDEGNLAYPSPLTPSTVFDLIWVAPLRALYLLFGPFPWHVHSGTMVIVMIDGLIYFTMAVAIFFGRAMFRRPEALILLLAGLMVVLVFGMGTSNFGTGMRHRAKLAGILIVLAVGASGLTLTWGQKDDKS